MIRGVLLDLAGVVYLGDTVLPGALDAIARLHAAGLPIGFITNTTRSSKAEVARRLVGMGLELDEDDLITPGQAARLWLADHKRSPHLLIHPNLSGEFEDLPAFADTAVVVGDAGRDFTYETLNTAFRALMSGADLVALAKNRAFMDEDGALSMDAGGFVAALEYASRREAIVLGKPARAFYDAAVAKVGCSPDETVMVGDDVESDVSGALKAGVGAALLVRTGKYTPGAEKDAMPPPTAVVDDIAAAVDWVLSRQA